MSPRLGTLVVAALVATGLTFTVGGAEAADATITLTPSPVAPDGTLTVAGTGCAAASAVNMAVFNTSGGSTLVDSTTADAAGEFEHDVPLENNFPVGAEIGVEIFCGELYDYSAPNAVDYVLVAVPTNGVAVSLSPASPRYGRETTATVISTPTEESGVSTVLVDGVPVGSGEPEGGVVELVLPTLGVGEHEVTVEFDPDAEGGITATAATTMTVRKALSRTRLRLSDKRIEKGEGATATVRVVCGSATPTGVLLLRDGKATLKVVALVAGDDGRKVVRLGSIKRVGKHPITAVYRGSGKVAGDASPRVVLKVIRKG